RSNHANNVRNDRACLLDILDAIAGIEKYGSSRASFDADERTQAWMVSRLQIIGEACRHLSSEFRERHAEIPWRLIIGMRHHLVHGYFDIDPDVVWAAITERIPELKGDVEHAMATDAAVFEIE
ncbi:MAG: HepT-like ribonuclease domain-containing protein, partial [Gemmatimonadaceae bacterium]